MTSTRVDRAALVRRATVELVAENGIHGTSMSQVAQRAGVATGTAYVHYESKDDLLIAALVEVKSQLGEVATRDVDLTRSVDEVFSAVWARVYDHLRNDPPLARFLLQIDASPLKVRAKETMGPDDVLTRLAAEMADHLVDLPAEILYELGLAPAVRLAAANETLPESQLSVVIDACWRAIGR